MYENTGLWVAPDAHETRYSTGHYSWQLTEHERYLGVQDPAFGNYAIAGRPEARLLREIIMSPLGIRSADIAQLSKRQQHGTIPNTYDFSTWAHVVTNAELTHRFAQRFGDDISDEQRLSWQLVVLMDDLPHGTGRHLTDMIIEGGFGGSEDAHQKRAMEAWKYGRVLEILQNHDIKVDKTGAIKNIKTPPWVETSAPDVCVERYQYTVEELRLWLETENMDEDAQAILKTLSNLDNIVITEDGRMAFKDQDVALLFSKAYLLLTTEHWNEPVHRVIEHLLIEAFKHSVYSRRLPEMARYDGGETADVVSYTYGVDCDLIHALATSRDDQDEVMFGISQLLSQLGKEERYRYVEYKRDQFVRFLRDPRAMDYPSPLLNGHSAKKGPDSSVVEIDVTRGKVPSQSRPTIKANAAKLIHNDSGGVQYGLSPMKNRYVDPLVITPDGPKPLSEVNKTFKKLLKQHAVIHASKIAVRLAVSGYYERLIRDAVQSNIEESRVPRRKLIKDQLRWQIDAAAERARKVALDSGRLLLSAA